MIGLDFFCVMISVLTELPMTWSQALDASVLGIYMQKIIIIGYFVYDERVICSATY